MNQYKNKVTSKILYVFMALSLVLTIGCFVAGHSLRAAEIKEAQDSMSVHGFNDLPSADMTPIDVEMKGVHLRIPRNYLVQGSVSPTTGEALLTMLVHLPEFGGATDETKDLFRSPASYRSPELITVYLQPSDHAFIGTAQKIMDEEKDIPNHEKTYGLTVSKKLPYFLYGHNKQLNQFFTMHRDALTASKVTYYRHSLDLPNGLKLTIDFVPSLLAQWQSIDAKVINLVQSFSMEN